ncbi:unnamed protein product [Sphagnum balticum]
MPEKVIYMQADGIPGRWWRAWPTLQSTATPVRVKNQRTATPSTTEQIRSRDAGPAHISIYHGRRTTIDLTTIYQVAFSVDASIPETKQQGEKDC